MTFSAEAKALVGAELAQLGHAVLAAKILAPNVIVVDMMSYLYKLGRNESWEAMGLALLRNFGELLDQARRLDGPFLMVLCADLYDTPSIQRDLVRTARKGKKVSNDGVSLIPEDFPVPPEALMEYLAISGWKEQVLLPRLGEGLREAIEQLEGDEVAGIGGNCGMYILRGLCPMGAPVSDRFMAAGRVWAYEVQGGWRQTDFFDRRLPIGTAEGDTATVALASYLGSHFGDLLEHLGVPLPHQQEPRVLALAIDGDIYYNTLGHATHSRELNFCICRPQPSDRNLLELPCYLADSFAEHIKKAHGIPQFMLLLLSTGSDYSFTLPHVTPKRLSPHLAMLRPEALTTTVLLQRLPIANPAVFRATSQHLGKGVLTNNGLTIAEPLDVAAWALVGMPKATVSVCGCPEGYRGPCRDFARGSGPVKNITVHHLDTYAKSLTAALAYFCNETSMIEHGDHGGVYREAYVQIGEDCLFGSSVPRPTQ